LIVCKDIDTGDYHVFRDLTNDPRQAEAFREFAGRVTSWIGHNILGYDFPVLNKLLDINIDVAICYDTLILSRLFNFSREGGHSIESYGIEYGIPKGKNYYLDFFTKWSQPLEDYCVRDVDICHKIYLRYLDDISDPVHSSAISLEQSFQLICNELHDRGFAFNTTAATSLLNSVKEELDAIDKEIEKAFPWKVNQIREIHPRVTSYGTLHKGDFRWVKDGDLSAFNGGPFTRITYEPFNASSHKQVIEVLANAHWSPTDKTTTHIDTEREINRLKYLNKDQWTVDLRNIYDILVTKLEKFKKTGWKINEQNLNSLPDTAPEPARKLARRILLESRRRTLTEWLNLVCLSLRVEKKNISRIGGDKIIGDESFILNQTTVSPLKIMLEWLKSKKVNVKSATENESSLLITVMAPDQSEGYSVADVMHVLDGLKQKGIQYEITSERIHGNFQALGAWTHRMSHQKPNTANIPNEVKGNGHPCYLGKELRSLWQAPQNRLLVGVDAEGIQLRIFAHYIDDPEFTQALVKGRKDDKTDPHSLNQRILGDVCNSRQAAKRFIYALLLGAGSSKLREILGCTGEEADQALSRLLERYGGFAYLKRTQIPRDARRGSFTGLDGRRVGIPGNTVGERKHLCMSGYLQNGEAIIIKKAAVIAAPQLIKFNSFFVDIVHDEYETETPENMEIALAVAKIKASAINEAGEIYKLKCPMAGSYWNDDHKTYTIGKDWSVTH
jgi:DNA polymerase I-like protein with 3'-5' exonuclease and polymerase domains